MKIERTGFNGEACRRRALATAMELARSAEGIIIPATKEEVGCLESGGEPDDRTLRLAMQEREALMTLSVASRRPMACASEDGGCKSPSSANVVLKGGGDCYEVRVFSGRPVKMPPQRLRDILDLYQMVSA